MPSITEKVTRNILRLFPAFESKNYRYYFSGQFVSLIGTWLQTVAQGWLVLQLTNSAFLIGLMSAIGSLPSLLFSLFGGVLIDRYPTRNIVFLTQALSMILAFALGILTLQGVITLWQIALLSFLLGTVNAVDMPARQAFVIEVAGRKTLGSAIALNSGVFNAARIIGPSIAGFLIAFVGIGGTFIINGISYIPITLLLLLITVPPFQAPVFLNPIKAIKEGISYAFSHSMIKLLLIYSSIFSIFGWSYTTLMPLIAEQTFGMDAAGLGYLYAATGLGAVCSTVIISAFSKKVGPIPFIFGGNLIFSLALFLFTLTTYRYIAYVLLFFVGLGLIFQLSQINTTIQQMVNDEMRGRVMSLYTLTQAGLFPIGNLQIGYIAEIFSPARAIQMGIFIMFLCGGFIYVNRTRISALYLSHKV